MKTAIERATISQPDHRNTLLRIPYPQSFWSCFLSLTLGISLSVLILVYPHALATSINDVNHGTLSLLLWGIAIGFIHGVGFAPRLSLWRVVFHPLLGWPLMGYGILMLLDIV